MPATTIEQDYALTRIDCRKGTPGPAADTRASSCPGLASFMAASISRPSDVSTYGAFRTAVWVRTTFLHLRFCIRAFIEICGMPNPRPTSRVRIGPSVSRNDSTPRTRSDRNGSGGMSAA